MYKTLEEAVKALYYPLNDYFEAHIAVDSLVRMLHKMGIYSDIWYSPNKHWHAYVERYAVPCHEHRSIK